MTPSVNPSSQALLNCIFPAIGLLTLVGTKLFIIVLSGIPGPIMLSPTVTPPLIFLISMSLPAAIIPAWVPSTVHIPADFSIVDTGIVSTTFTAKASDSL